MSELLAVAGWALGGGRCWCWGGGCAMCDESFLLSPLSTFLAGVLSLPHHSTLKLQNKINALLQRMSRFSMIHRVSVIFRLPSLLHCSPTKRVVLLAIVFLRQAASFTPQIFTHHTSRRTPIMDELATEERDNSAQFHMLNYNESDFIVDPLLKYLATDPAGNRSNQHFNVEEAINALTTDGYYHIPGVLTAEECNHALGQMWDFVEDISAGCVNRNDPKSWYPKGELKDADEILNSESNVGGRNEKPSESEEDIDPWPHTGYSSFPDMFQSLGAGKRLLFLHAVDCFYCINHLNCTFCHTRICFGKHARTTCRTDI